MGKGKNQEEVVAMRTVIQSVLQSDTTISRVIGRGKKTGCPIVTWATSYYESKSTNIIWYEDSEVSESLWLAGMK